MRNHLLTPCLSNPVLPCSLQICMCCAAECSGAGPGHTSSLDPPDRLPFSLSQVAVFCLVARTGSFKSCALALSISQPAVSKSLATFERVRLLYGSRC